MSKLRDYIELVEKYSANNSYLLHYMRNGSFDPYSLWFYVCEWIAKNGYLKRLAKMIQKADPDAKIQSSDDLVEQEPDWFFKLPKAAQEKCGEDVINRLMREEPADAPTWAHMSLSKKRLLPRTTWLVHFTDDPWDIARRGFKIGMEDMDRLGLTTSFKNDSHAKRNGGYNFAFLADSRYARNAADENKYGKQAVMFQNSGVIADHHGDQEEQVMFWGKDVDPRDIVVLIRDYDDWTVRGHTDTRRGDDLLFKGDFESCVTWVENNFNQYRHYLTRR